MYVGTHYSPYIITNVICAHNKYIPYFNNKSNNHAMINSKIYTYISHNIWKNKIWLLQISPNDKSGNFGTVNTVSTLQCFLFKEVGENSGP